MPPRDGHLDVDLSFLDVPSVVQGAAAADTRFKTNWRNIAIIVGILVFGVVLVVAYSGQSPTTGSGSNTPYSDSPSTPAANSDDVTVGDFRCSRDDSAEADRLSPTESEDLLTSDKNALDLRATELDQLKSQISTDPVNEYSTPDEIQAHNALIDNYNTQLNSYKSDADALHLRIAAFNAAIEAHNSYLLQHCTRQ